VEARSGGSPFAKGATSFVHWREVGRLQVGVRGDQLLGGLRLAALGLFDDLAPVHERRGSLGEGRAARLGTAHEQLGHLPLSGAHLLDRHVFDRRFAAAVVEVELATQHLGDDANLAAALLETAHVDEARRDDLTAADRGDPADREEHAAFAGDLDDEADHSRRLGSAVDHEHVADLAEAIAGRVEDGAPGQSGDEDSGGTHLSNLDLRRRPHGRMVG
jgi:hypothetical protein